MIPREWHALRVRLEAPDHLLDDLTRLNRVRAGPNPRPPDPWFLLVIRAILNPPQADAVPARAVIGRPAMASGLGKVSRPPS